MIVFKTPVEAYINYYITEKEKDLPIKLRKRLNQVHFLHKKRSLDLALAIYLIAKKFSNGDIHTAKDVLWSLYHKRRAYITNAKKEYQKLQEKEKKEIKYCACGCGEVVRKKNKFILGHNSRCKTQEQKNQQAEFMRNSRSEKRSYDS